MITLTETDTRVCPEIAKILKMPRSDAPVAVKLGAVSGFALRSVFRDMATLDRVSNARLDGDDIHASMPAGLIAYMLGDPRIERIEKLSLQ